LGGSAPNLQGRDDGKKKEVTTATTNDCHGVERGGGGGRNEVQRRGVETREERKIETRAESARSKELCLDNRRSRSREKNKEEEAKKKRRKLGDNSKTRAKNEGRVC